jgi:hypothetical protein
MGLKVAYNKISVGTSVEWIGALIQVVAEENKIVITLPARKFAELVERIEEITATAQSGQARADLVRRLAGLGSWIGGLVPQLRPFNQMLWAALRTAVSGYIYQLQVKIALDWILQFASSWQGDFIRIIHTEWCEVITLTLEVDASPVGGGFVAWRGQPSDRRRVKPDWYGLCKWTSEDEERTGGKIGAAASQALWEAYAFVIALKLSLSEHSKGKVQVFGDAEGIMKSMVTFGAKSPRINALAREAALVAAPLGLELAAIHIWSEENSWADALSRVAEGVALPSVFSNVACVDQTWCSWLTL